MSRAPSVDERGRRRGDEVEALLGVEPTDEPEQRTVGVEAVAAP